jgi:DNA modification methylase
MSDVVLSARTDRPSLVLRDLLGLHVPDGALIVDVTYGRGTLWADTDLSRYVVLGSDLIMGIDCTSLPYGDGSIDAVILDPPYVAGFFRPHKIGQDYGDFTHRYSAAMSDVRFRYHAGVVDIFTRGGREAHRVLRAGGRLIVKCQDEVHAGKQYLTHVEVVNVYAERFYARDLFVVMRRGGNFGTRGRAKACAQQHARKNHSYFVVFEKRASGRDRTRDRTWPESPSGDSAA